MNFFNYILLFFLLIIVDLPWLYFGSGFTKKMIHNIQKSDMKIKYLPAVIVYLFVTYLVTLPTTPLDAFLLGVSVYGVYDFTNLSILTNYSLTFAVMDTLWGGTLFVIAYYIIDSLKLK